MRTGARRGERGAVSVEFVIMLPLLILLVAIVVAGARIWWARTCVEQLASSAARQASISRTAGEAAASAQQLVRQDAASTGVSCAGGPSLSLDASGFAVPVGTPASVTARVRCVVPLADVVVPGLGGSLTVDASATSTLDRYRGRA